MKRVSSWRDPFTGHRVYSPTAGNNIGHNWLIVDTSAAGTPTYVPATPDRGLKVDFDTGNEVQNVCAAWADKLQFDIDDIIEARIRLKMNQAAIDATTQFAIGLVSARNDAIDSIAAAALFRLVGADSTTLLVVETDDGVNDNDDKATGKALINAEKDLVISFANGKKDVRFFVDGEPVAPAVTFDMSNYSGGLQPFQQLQKTANANANGFTVRYFEVTYRDGSP